MSLKIPSLALTLLLLSAIQSMCFTQSTYYIKPTPDTQCPAEPCLTLSEYAQGHPLISDTTLIFLPGNHSLDRDIVVTNVTRFVMLGDSTDDPDITTRIACTSTAGFVFQDISEVQVHLLEINSCGNKERYAMLVSSVTQFQINNSTFHDSRHTSLSAVNSILSIYGARFEGSSSTGLVLSNSTVEFDGCTDFYSNDQGGINAVQTTIIIMGTITFAYNSALNGGGISAIDSSIYCSGIVTCINNTAVSEGGGMYLERSDMDNEGSISFSGNFAGAHGGGIAAIESDIHFCSTATFIGNSAITGSGVGLVNSTLKSSTEIYFTKNTASNAGGGLFGTNSILAISGSASFEGNQATFGGGIDIELGLMNMEGSIVFSNNFASNLGGGLNAVSSSVFCQGNVFFINNSAVNLGGGIGGGLGSHLFMGGNITFVRNMATYGGGLDLDSSSMSMQGSIRFINNQAEIIGGGVVTQQSNLTLIGNTVAMGNLARYGGAIDTEDSNLTMEGNVSIEGNFASFSGGGFRLLNSSVSYNGSVMLVGNTADYGGGISVIISNLVIVGTSTFLNNTARYGGAVHVHTNSTVSFTGDNVYSGNLAIYGGGSYLFMGTLVLSGSTTFYKNIANYGGGIQGSTGTIRLSGNASFTENSAVTNGGGVSLASSSQWFLSPDATAFLSRNSAGQFGGAIFVDDDPFQFCSPPGGEFFLPCFFQPSQTHRVQLKLENNHAVEAGRAVFGGLIDVCKVSDVSESGSVFDNITSITDNSSTDSFSVISSNPFQVCPCHIGYPNCNLSELFINAFPGQLFPLHVVAVGQRNGTVPSVISGRLNGSGAALADLQEFQLAQVTCTPLQYAVFSHNSSVSLHLSANTPCFEPRGSLYVHITLLSCPVGFALSDTSQGCTCEKRLLKYTRNCNITSGDIEQEGDFWVGIDRDQGVILHPHCPFDYCISHPTSFTINETNKQCAYDRKGLLCGGCQSGLSLILGSSQCKQCSNSYLSLLIVFAVAGIALVVLLLACNLTVAMGTINGLIFYANIIAVDRSVFFPSGDTNILTVFIAWLNLDLGVETCFYDGMDAYGRIWLQFVFPAYVWILIAITIFLGHYSTWAAKLLGRNPVAVLATLVLLSYTKLLRTIIAAFSVTYLEYPEGSEVAVWLYDGNVQYLKGKHIPLFLVAMLVLLVLFLPYTLLLLVGQWIQSKSEKRICFWINDYRIKAFLDAYHGPFHIQHRYWPGLLLLVRCSLFLIFAFNIRGNTSLNLLAIAVSTTGLIVWISFVGGVYVNKHLQRLETLFILNAVILSSATLYVQSAGGNQAALTYALVGAAFLTFIGILIYHSFSQMKQTSIWKRYQRYSLLQRTSQPANTIANAIEQADESDPQMPQFRSTFVDLLDLIAEEDS